MKTLEIIRNDKCMKYPRTNFSGNYVSVELDHKIRKISNECNVPMNWLTEYALRTVFGLPTNFTEIKEIKIK
jgi:hypothetical protein